MDAIFGLSDDIRPDYILNLMHSFASSYICLWTYSSDHNFLYCKEGYYQEETQTNQTASSSSSVSVARRLFDNYKDSFFIVGNEFVPGLAFRHRNPYLELQELDLQSLASIESQRRFYQEARIKVAVFLGCEKGEIELGMSYIPQMSFQMKMQSLFPQDFARTQPYPIMETPRLEQQQQQSRPSPSSSFSMDSPEYSSLLYTIPITSSSYLQSSQPITTETQTQTQTQSNLLPPRLPDFRQPQNIVPFPTQESTDAALTRAYLAILSSSPPNTSSTTLFPNYSYSQLQEATSQKSSAFKSYESSQSTRPINTNVRRSRQTMMKRAIVFYRGLNYRRMQEYQAPQGTNRLHHMISERRRREKITESFQALRSLLPQGTKKDKATVLRTTKEYLSSLKSQVSELSKRNKVLEAQLFIPIKETTTATTTTSKQQLEAIVSTIDERLHVRVTPVSESTSQRIVDLQVMLRGSNHLASDLVIRVLEFLKQVRDQASLISVEAQSSNALQETTQLSPTNWATFRLRIEETEWDESTFKEAVRRVLADLAQ